MNAGELRDLFVEELGSLKNKKGESGVIRLSFGPGQQMVLHAEIGETKEAVMEFVEDDEIACRVTMRNFLEGMREDLARKLGVEN